MTNGNGPVNKTVLSPPRQLLLFVTGMQSSESEISLRQPELPHRRLRLKESARDTSCMSIEVYCCRFGVWNVIDAKYRGLTALLSFILGLPHCRAPQYYPDCPSIIAASGCFP